MQPFPHHYQVQVNAEANQPLTTGCDQLPPLRVDTPTTFGGSGEHWSPEELLLAALGNCYALSFRALAKASGLAWVSLDVAVEGVLDKVERQMRFTRATLRVGLTLAPGADLDAAERQLQRAESICIVANSLRVPLALITEVQAGVG
ncbi:OsmC family protein [Motiliproteus sediminis]|uniref:OsmC family protein n=1 Tax=Motiliproteus sediminis TaxID=1468178 RepID=UPI001AEFCCC4|nr:OsmC family protein [Motiliproteus sediminis]